MRAERNRTPVTIVALVGLELAALMTVVGGASTALAVPVGYSVGTG